MKKLVALILALSMAFALCGCASSDYKKAQKLLDAGAYDEAIALFEQLDDYKDSPELLKRSCYEKAVALADGEDYDQARALFESLGDYQDSRAKAVDCVYQMALSRYAEQDYPGAETLFREIETERDVSRYIWNCLFRRAKIGETVLFGTYEQDTDPTNGEEPIEWIILTKEEDRMLVVSLYGLEVQQYDSHGDYLDSREHHPVCWANSEVRAWMNDSFFDQLFSAEEQRLVLMTQHDNCAEGDYYAKKEFKDYLEGYEESTEDRLFLLSRKEVETLFPSNVERCVLPTRQAIANGAYHDNDAGYCRWWLRDVYNDREDVTEWVVYRFMTVDYKFVQEAKWVEEDGSFGSSNMDRWFSTIGSTVYGHGWLACVRPAMWIDISIIT